MLPSLARLATGAKDDRLEVVERVKEGDYTETLNESAKKSGEILEDVKKFIFVDNFDATPANLAKLVQIASDLDDLAAVWNSVKARYEEMGAGVYADVIFVANAMLQIVERYRSKVRELSDQAREDLQTADGGK